ncbi:MAG TPA: tetratricopeptide repeat protein [Candidatus Acidoferrum sp.]|nr:tetratricopeptide repeat protein [Candidatus Acidoferrum sp.]
MLRRSRKTVSPEPGSIRGEKHARGFLLRWFPLAAVSIFLFSAGSGPAHPEKHQSGGREQVVLQIQHLIQEHNLPEARRLLVEASKQYPSDEGLDNLLGIVEAQQGNYSEAEKSFRHAVAKAPRFTGAYLNLGRLYQENVAADPQARRKALEIYRQVLSYEPINQEAIYQSSALLLQRGKYQTSLDYLTRLSSESENSAQTLSILCADQAGLGHRAATEDAATKLLAASDFSEADMQQALLGLTPGKRDDLILTLLEGLQKRQALSPPLLQTLGFAYERTKRLAEARATLEKSFDQGKSSVALLVELTRIARLQKDYQAALGYLGHARELEPDNASLHYYFGVVCLDMNLVAEARNSFEKAVKLQPENPEYNYAMGAASAFRHDPAEAVPYFERFIKLKPQDPRGKLAMGAALFRAKDYDAATPWLKKAAIIPETAAKAHYYEGAIALEDGRLEEGVAELQEALKGHADYVDALAELGRYYLMRKEYKQAENRLHHALKIQPDHYTANFYLLMLYTRTKDPRQEAQAKRFDELKNLLAEKTQEFLRIVNVRPVETP